MQDLDFSELSFDLNRFEYLYHALLVIFNVDALVYFRVAAAAEFLKDLIILDRAEVGAIDIVVVRETLGTLSTDEKRALQWFNLRLCFYMN